MNNMNIEFARPKGAKDKKKRKQTSHKRLLKNAAKLAVSGAVLYGINKGARRVAKEVLNKRNKKLDFQPGRMYQDGPKVVRRGETYDIGLKDLITESRYALIRARKRAGVN